MSQIVQYMKSQFKNCVLVMNEKDRKNEVVLFCQEKDGRITCNLDGYAIIPIKEYRGLLENEERH